MPDDTDTAIESGDDDATKYRFYGSVRRGFRPTAPFSESDAADGSLPSGGGIEVSYDAVATTDGDRTSERGTVDLEMYGPGRVTGFDRRQIVRREPKPGSDEFPPNYFPLVEIDAVDLPWLFSPTRTDDHGRNLPWLRLVVVEGTAGVETESDGSRPLPALRIGGDADPSAQLPPADEAWAWTHSQIVGSPKAQHGRSIPEELAADSTATVARLLCPRNLTANTSYVAALVPTFEAGRLAGLGESVPDEEGLSLAWGGDTGDELVLPMYDHWAFETGKKGDFEYLARKLTPRELSGATVGVRTVDASDPGPETLASPGTTVDVGGALGPTDGVSVDDYPAGLTDELRTLLNRPESIQDRTSYPAVGPPIYGQWHAQRDELDDVDDWANSDENEVEWLYDLNLDPSYRVPAGIGTGVVRDNQEELMASAWEQVGEIRRANRLLSAAQLSRAASNTVARTLAGRTDTGTLLSFTAPAHGRVLQDGETAASRLADSSFPEATLSAPFRRLVSGRGPLARRVDGAVDAPSIVRGLLDGRLDPPSGTGGPDGSKSVAGETDPDRLCEQSRALDEESTEREVDERVLAARRHLDEIEGSSRTVMDALERILDGLREGSIDRDAYESQHTRIGVSWDQLYGRASTFQGRNPDEGPFGTVVAAELAEDLPSVSDDLDHRRRGRLYGDLMDPLRGPVPLSEPFEEVTVRHVERAIDRVLDVQFAIHRIREHLDERPGSDADYLEGAFCGYDATPRERPAPDPQGAIDASLDFERALEERVSERLGGDVGERADPLDTIMAAPEFPQPTYRSLKDVSTEHLLPGADEVEDDTVGALATNPAFIEAYLVGLNHEMARELRWRRYPTDQRGSYFKRFWDQRSRVPKPDDPDRLDDVFPLHLWDDEGPNRRARSPLGTNTRTGSERSIRDPPPTDPAATTNVVVLIRGNLLRRYPNTAIYAAKAYEEGDDRVPRWPSSTPSDDPAASEHVEYPVFRGEIEPDMTFLGFDLTPDEVTGADPTASVTGGEGETDDLGWFFAFEEPVGEARFGLDEPGDDEDTSGIPAGITHDDGEGGRTTITTADDSAEHGWSALSWGHVTSGDAPTHVDVSDARPASGNWAVEENTSWLEDGSEPFDREDAAAWGTNGAHMARITWQRPVRIAIHAQDIVPGSGGGD
ncbi:hypothetical protein [Haloplanus salinarum]|uniref:hypothetical protein n=1 Tax=Haloplanus salinarum TaxID=1912324 RepID=UPI00214CC616|nr:hypothetical protein [Haloplanus salinarum]